MSLATLKKSNSLNKLRGAAEEENKSQDMKSKKITSVFIQKVPSPNKKSGARGDFRSRRRRNR